VQTVNAVTSYSSAPCRNPSRGSCTVASFDITYVPWYAAAFGY
jgi:hypothetical protein